MRPRCRHLLIKQAFAALVASAKFDELGSYFTPAELVANHGLKNAGQLVDYLLRPAGRRRRANRRDHAWCNMLPRFDGKRTTTIKDEGTLAAKLRGVVHLVMTMPTCQLC